MTWVKGSLVWVRVAPDYGRRLAVYDRTVERGRHAGWRVVWLKRPTRLGIVNRRLELPPDRVAMYQDQEATP